MYYASKRIGRVGSPWSARVNEKNAHSLLTSFCHFLILSSLLLFPQILFLSLLLLLLLWDSVDWFSVFFSGLTVNPKIVAAMMATLT